MKSRWQTERAASLHVDDWLMTYADMITLLLCFFAIFLTVTVPKQAQPQKPELASTVTPPAPAHFLEGDLPFHGVPTADRPTDGLFATQRASSSRQGFDRPPDRPRHPPGESKAHRKRRPAATKGEPLRPPERPRRRS